MDVTDDTPLTDQELAALRSAGYEPAGGGNIKGDGVTYLRFRKDGEIRTGTRAQWRAVIAGLEVKEDIALLIAEVERLRALITTWYLSDNTPAFPAAEAALVEVAKEIVGHV